MLIHLSLSIYIYIYIYVYVYASAHSVLHVYGMSEMGNVILTRPASWRSGGEEAGGRGATRGGGVAAARGG